MQVKTKQEWIDEFNFDRYTLDAQYLNFGNLYSAKTTKEWQEIMGKKRVLSDFSDQNAALTMKGSTIRWVGVKQQGTKALLYFHAVSDMGRQIPDSELRPNVANPDNEKTGRSWEYAVKPTSIFPEKSND